MEEQKTMNVTAALAMVERKSAANRDYQAANIIMASIQYIESLEKKIKELESDGEQLDDDVRHARHDGEDDGAVA